MRGRLRTLFFVVFVVVVTFVLWDLNHDVAIQENIQETSTAELSSAFNDFCQFLENPLTGVEGESPQEFALTGLLVAFRHGERSPVVQLRRDAVHPDCSAYYDKDRRAFENYYTLVNSLDFKRFLRLDSSFVKFPVIPERSKCQPGRMTAEGALQLVRLGNFLRLKYSDSGFFADLSKDGISLTSSMFPRTFQSAIAFTSAFFYPMSQPKMSTKLPSVFLKASRNTFFCVDNSCACPALKSLRIEHELERSQNFFDKAPEKLQRRLADLVDVLGIKVLEHPLEVVDATLGRYACRRLPLPCKKNGDCYTLDDFSAANSEAIVIVKRLSDISTLNSTARRLFVAESYSILSNLVEMIRSIRKGDASNGNQIRVFSGHDVTLWPLLYVLGLSEGGETDVTLQVNYASRIVFEIYTRAEKKAVGDSVFIRVVINGVDRTGQIKFCQPLQHGLCSGKKFEQYAGKDMFSIAGASTYEELCKVV